MLIALVAFQIALFSLVGTNFASPANGLEITRLTAELGLLALGLTPVIVTGGIDLSVGSMMGLAAVVFGSLWRDHGVSLPLAAAATLLLGLAGGALNALLIARISLPPLIVTLGTYSLFRGLAEGITGGAENFTGFPSRFLFLGQGYVFGILPMQAGVMLFAACAFYVLLHRTSMGRTLFAIGFSPAGAHYAGIPVRGRLAQVYALSGFSASAAGLVYVAHLGQAKADAGTGYELMAITAVVLGGTSIFGGRGSIGGTLLGLAAIAVLQNGLRLSAMPAELTGILTGALLVASIGLDRPARSRTTVSETKEFEVKNSQIAFLSTVILIAAGLVAGTNWWLVQSVRAPPAQGASAVPANRPVLGLMPKAKGDPYFVSCKKGAEEAARELGADLVWDGPTDLDPAKQNEVVEGWITRGMNSIAVSVENQAAISTVLRKAKAKGIPVVAWDSDAAPDARNYFINQATPRGIGTTLMDETARILGGKGEFAIVTASLSASNQNEWMKYIKARLKEKYPGIKLAVVRPSEGDRDRAFNETQTILKVYPNVKVIMGIAAPAVPGAAEAVKQSGRKDVKVTGLSLPNMCKPYVHDGTIESIVLWNTRDLGYLTVWVSDALARGTLKPEAREIQAGRLGRVEIRDGEVLLGAPFVFNKSNIDQFDF